MEREGQGLAPNAAPNLQETQGPKGVTRPGSGMYTHTRGKSTTQNGPDVHLGRTPMYAPK